MDALTVRVLPFETRDGAANMAADEAMAEFVVQSGRGAMRFYEWSGPTISLGYFQSHSERRQHERFLSLPFVRRPSGGLTLVHHFELTYALAVPNQQKQPSQWLCDVHNIIRDALMQMGVVVDLAHEDSDNSSDCLCFHHITHGDVLLANYKVVGSAQRRRKGVLLQHGAILLETSPYTPSLPGIRELSGKPLSSQDIAHLTSVTTMERFGWRLVYDDWSADETALIERLTVTKYSADEWNLKR